MNILYKAKVYLSANVTESNGFVATPCLETVQSESKENVLKFVKALYSQGTIRAYRMLYSVKENPGQNDWYNDSEVVFMESDRRIVTELK